jgi:hypothetical protein
MKREMSQCCAFKQYTQTETEVTANRADIIIKNKKQKTCTPIDVATPADRNVVQMKKLKYNSLDKDTAKVELKCTVVPVVIRATGMVTKCLRKNLPGKYSIDSLQQRAVLGTAHIIQKVLQCETGSVSGGGHRWVKGSAGKERLVTRS